jgi:WD40 repeat protein
MKHLLLFVGIIFILAGCASKEYYEPEDTVGDYENNKASLNADIISLNKDGATLDNGEIITRKGVSKFKIPEGYNFLNISEDTVISSNYKDKVLIDKKELEVGGVVVAASLKDDKLALLFSDNSIELYDTNNNKILLREYFTHSFVNDTRIANPYFMSNIILFPTLDGKIVVVSEGSNKVIKNIVVDADGQFNNIIFLDVIDDTLVAATANKVISVGDGVLNIKKYTIRDIITKNNNIYIATIDGQIIKTDISLNIINRRKYKYAKIYALAYGTSLYALESQGYLINIADDFKSDKIYDFDFDNEEKVIALDDTIYYDDEYIILK